MNDHTKPPRERVIAQSRSEMAGMDQGMRVLSYLIAGVLVYGGLGWAGDHFLGTHFLLPIGIVLGAAGGCYVIIRRYGQLPGVSAVAAGKGPGQVASVTPESGHRPNRDGVAATHDESVTNQTSDRAHHDAEGDR
jgi:F0F1-type ATP synthase assembly protein I